MSLFKVCWEEDGKVIKEPGIVTTELTRCEHFYVADTLETVWNAIGDIRNDPEQRKRLVSLADCSVGITVLTDQESSPHE